MKLNPMQQLFSSVLNTWRIANTVGYKHLGVSAFYCGYGSSVDTWGGAENGVDPIRKITHNVGDLLFSMKEKIDSVITGSVELTLEVAASFLTKVSVTMLVIGGYRIPGYKHFESVAMMKGEWDDNLDQAVGGRQKILEALNILPDAAMLAWSSGYIDRIGCKLSSIFGGSPEEICICRTNGYEGKCDCEQTQSGTGKNNNRSQALDGGGEKSIDNPMIGA